MNLTFGIFVNKEEKRSFHEVRSGMSWSFCDSRQSFQQAGYHLPYRKEALGRTLRNRARRYTMVDQRHRWVGSYTYTKLFFDNPGRPHHSETMPVLHHILRTTAGTKRSLVTKIKRLMTPREFVTRKLEWIRANKSIARYHVQV